MLCAGRLAWRVLFSGGSREYFWAIFGALWGLVAVPILLLVRSAAVTVPWIWSRYIKTRRMTGEEAVLVTWCGLRGTVSLAMAVAIPTSLVGSHNGHSVRDIAILSTFMVVLATLSLQGLTIPVLVKYLRKKRGPEVAP